MNLLERCTGHSKKLSYGKHFSYIYTIYTPLDTHSLASHFSHQCSKCSPKKLLPRFARISIASVCTEASTITGRITVSIILNNDETGDYYEWRELGREDIELPRERNDEGKEL